MPSIPVYPPSINLSDTNSANPTKLTSSNPPTTSHPPLLQTPSGLALLEIQGSLNSTLAPEYPSPSSSSSSDGSAAAAAIPTLPVGRLVFPLYDPDNGPEDTAWQKRVYLYVGKHQRLTGEVKKLGKAVAVLRRKRKETGVMGDEEGEDEDEDGGEENGALEIAEIVRWKIVFNHRPEPVGGASEDVDVDAGADG